MRTTLTRAGIASRCETFYVTGAIHRFTGSTRTLTQYRFVNGEFVDKLVPDGSQGGRFDYSCDDVVVGTVVLLKHGTRMQVWSLEIYPEYRGLGHGRALTRAIVGVARHEGCDTVWLQVKQDNTTAVKLYESEGFVVTESVRNDYTMERLTCPTGS